MPTPENAPYKAKQRETKTTLRPRARVSIPGARCENCLGRVEFTGRIVCGQATSRYFGRQVNELWGCGEYVTEARQ